MGKKKADEEAEQSQLEINKLKLKRRQSTGEKEEVVDEAAEAMKAATAGLKKTKDEAEKVDIDALMAGVEVPVAAERKGEAADDLMAALADDPLAQERAEQEARKKMAQDEKIKAQQAAMSLFGGGEEEDIGASRKGLRKRAVQQEETVIEKIESKEDISARLAAKAAQLKKIEEEEKRQAEKK